MGSVRNKAVDKGDFLQKFCDAEKERNICFRGLADWRERVFICVFVGLVFFRWLAALGRRDLSMRTVREQDPVVKLK